MSRLRADLDTMAGAPAGSYVLPNTRAATDNFVLEYDNSGYTTVAWDEYRVAARSGYIVKRSQDADGNDVDWNALTSYAWYWSGTVVTPSGRYAVVREPLTWYDEQQPTPPIDSENAINLELAYDAIVDTLLVAGGAFQVDERGFAFGDPPPTYNAATDTYSGTGILGNEVRLAGVNADTLQFYWDVLTGKSIAGNGAVVLDEDGVTIEADAGAHLEFGVSSDPHAVSIAGYSISTLDSLSIEVNTAYVAEAGQLTLKVRNDAPTDMALYLFADTADQTYASFYSGAGTFLGVAIGEVKPSAMLHISDSTAPDLVLEDETVSAKSLRLVVDADKATFEEWVGGTDVMVLDLANARVGIGTASPTSGYKLETSESILVNSASNSPGVTIIQTASSSSAVGAQSVWAVNDGAAMASGDRLGTFLFQGRDNAALVSGAAVIVQTTEAWGASARGSKITFYTTPNGSTTLTAAVVINQDAEVDVTGNVDVASGKVYKVNGTQVVGARDTGWTAMTGTANENTSYDTASVTLPQLAGRVMALQAALTTHGLIGA